MRSDEPWQERANEWLTSARQDLVVVKIGAANQMVPDSVFGFHAQQAIEKVLKGLVTAKKRKPQRTHNLRALADRVRDLYKLGADPLGGMNITRWGTAYRYPGEEPPAESLDRAVILKQVESRLELAERLLRRPNR